jgi:hypothetical protein
MLAAAALEAQDPETKKLTLHYRTREGTPTMSPSHYPAKTGSCNRCGKCCVEGWRFAYEAKMILPGLPDFETLRPAGDPKTRKNKDPEAKCPQFAWDAETGEAACLAWGTERMHEICRLFPIFPSDRIFEDCGFHFEAPA